MAARPQRDTFEYELLTDPDGLRQELVNWKLFPADELKGYWVFIKGIIGSKEFRGEKNLTMICTGVGRALAEVEANLVIGSWSGVNAEVAKSFLIFNRTRNNPLNEYFRIFTESDIPSMAKELSSQVKLEFKDVHYAEKPENFADACVMIGDTDSSEYIAEKILDRGCPVYPILESGAEVAYRKRIRNLSKEQLDKIYGVDFNPKILKTNYIEAIDYIGTFISKGVEKKNLSDTTSENIPPLP